MSIRPALFFKLLEMITSDCIYYNEMLKRYQIALFSLLRYCKSKGMLSINFKATYSDRNNNGFSYLFCCRIY